MGAYIARRTLLAALTLTFISMFSFLIVKLPAGDYVDQMVYHQGQMRGRALSIAEEAELREFYGLNRGAFTQYWGWISGIVLRGDFGTSWNQDTQVDITRIVHERLGVTIALSVFTIVLTWILAIPIGIYSAMRQHSVGDYAFTFLGFTGLAVPDFLLGLLLMYLFLAYFHQSVGGLFSGEYQTAPWSFGKVLDLLQHLIIPAIVLGTAGTAGLIRTMRNNLLDELYKPYVVAARAKGQANWKVIVKYPVRVAINPFVSSIGSMLPGLVGGSVIVSIVLSLPTLGPTLYDALRLQDQFLAGTIILLLAALTVVGVLISDLLLMVVDPRISLTGSKR